MEFAIHGREVSKAEWFEYFDAETERRESMSNRIFGMGNLIVASFYGGVGRGRCLQFDTPTVPAQLDLPEVRLLQAELENWLLQADKNKVKSVAFDEELFQRMLKLLASYGKPDAMFPSDECPCCGVPVWERENHKPACLCIEAARRLYPDAL